MCYSEQFSQQFCGVIGVSVFFHMQFVWPIQQVSAHIIEAWMHCSYEYTLPLLDVFSTYLK